METLLSRTYHLVTPETVPDFAYSPNPHNGSSGSNKNNSELEPKAKVVPQRDAPPAKPTHSIPLATSAPPRKRQQKESSLDLERLEEFTTRYDTIGLPEYYIRLPISVERKLRVTQVISDM
ncbi:hypothetical protein ACSBR1_001245 [Camellia fascicularis]